VTEGALRHTDLFYEPYEPYAGRASRRRGGSPRPRLDDCDQSTPRDHWHEVIVEPTLS
jgi:hypothetical protein